MKRGILILSLLVLAGCAQRQSSQIGTVIPQPPNVTPILPSYCYKTLSSVDCYAQPLEGQERRLVNYQGPPPPGFGWAGAGSGNR
jgi:hypothetical protein